MVASPKRPAVISSGAGAECWPGVSTGEVVMASTVEVAPGARSTGGAGWGRDRSLGLDRARRPAAGVRQPAPGAGRPVRGGTVGSPLHDAVGGVRRRPGLRHVRL